MVTTFHFVVLGLAVEAGRRWSEVRQWRYVHLGGYTRAEWNWRTVGEQMDRLLS